MYICNLGQRSADPIMSGPTKMPRKRLRQLTLDAPIRSTRYTKLNGNYMGVISDHHCVFF